MQKLMNTTSYDKTASIVITLLILIGSTVAILLGIWLTTAFFVQRPPEPVAVQMYDSGTGVRDDAEFDPDVTDPGMDVELDELTLQDALQMISDTISSNASLFADPSQVDEDILLPGGERGDGRTRGDGDGRGRRHWEFLFPEGCTTNEYAKMLDFFGIELAVIQSGGRVAYISQLSSDRPLVRYGASELEKRYYLTWLKGDLQEAEQELLKKAGVEHDGRLILKFLSPELETKLATMEVRKAGDQKDRIRATYFGIKRGKTANDFEFFVANQILQ